MKSLFDLVEPMPTSEMIANYWHFLKGLNDKERSNLGPIEIVLKSRAVARGWPVGLKNQTLALMTEAELTQKSAIVMIDISEVSSVSFFASHLILPFVTAGAVSRSPLQKDVSLSEVKSDLLLICEEIRKLWSTRIYFDTDPTTYGIDELLNLNEVLQGVLRYVANLRDNPLMYSELQDCKSLQVVNALDMKDIAVTRKDSGEIEVAFKFSRALPKNVDDVIASLFASIF